ncbi:hypothetical protein ACFQ2B_26110 [Streptomyces stramineus]|uniref:Tail assembly chaperone n=1 Tax=Streptomyces stramineus TaxID=173861 RepID=A0ABP3JJI3_9ACTN
MTAATKPDSAEKTAAKEAEASLTPVTVEHGGIEFTIPHPLRMPVKLLRAQDELEAVMLILGEEQWAAFEDSGATIGDFQDLADKVAAARGHDDAGN